MKTPTSPKTVLRSGMAALFLAASFSVQAALSDFNSPGQLDAHFYRTGDAALQASEASAGGLSNSGRLVTAPVLSSSGRTSIVSRTTVGSVLPAFTLSVYFQWDQVEWSGTGEIITLGIGKTASGVYIPAFGSNNSEAKDVNQFHIGLGLWTRNVDGHSVSSIRVAGSSAANDVLTNFSSGTALETQLTQGNWYYLEAAFEQNTNGDGYTVNLRLVDSDGNGTLATGSRLEYQTSFVNPSLVASDFQSYLLHRSGPFSGASSFDNLDLPFQPQPIPEPSAFLLLGAGALGLGLYRRLNRSLPLSR